MAEKVSIPFNVNDENMSNREEKAKDAELLIVLNGINDSLSSIAKSLSSLNKSKK